MPRLSLRAKLLASFIVVLLPVLGMLINDYRNENERRIQSVLEDQMQTAQAIAALVDASFDEAVAVAWSVTNDPVVYTFDPSQLDPHLQRLAPYYPQYELISVVDATGLNLGRSVPYPPGAPRVGIGDRPYFQEVMATGQPVISKVIISRLTSRPALTADVPLRHDEGKPIGAVVVVLYMEALSSKLESVALKPEQNVILVDKAGMVAFHTALPDIPWEQRDLSKFEPVTAALEGRATEARRFVSPLLSDYRIGAFTPTPKYGWVVGVTIGEDAALAPVGASLRDQLIGFSAVTVLSVALVLILSYLLLQPIRHLTDHALSVARGQLQPRVYVKTGDELEDLANSFNYMAGQLEVRDAENARLSRLKDEFLSVAAHELKTPVTGIKGYAQLLLQREHEGVSPRGLKALEAINRQADRINRLVNELLDVSRIQIGRLELRLARLDLSQLIAEVVERAKVATEKHRLLFQSPGPVFVNVNRDRIEQVLNNLLDNAIKFSPEGGDIETAVRVADGEAVVSVRDYGVGIPKEAQKHVFERFYRAHVGTPYDYGGTGIGLYISREIILRHGGRMWFESEEGKGSTFYFSLPLAGAEG